MSVLFMTQEISDLPVSWPISFLILCSSCTLVKKGSEAVPGWASGSIQPTPERTGTWRLCAARTERQILIDCNTQSGELLIPFPPHRPVWWPYTYKMNVRWQIPYVILKMLPNIAAVANFCSYYVTGIHYDVNFGSYVRRLQCSYKWRYTPLQNT